MARNTISISFDTETNLAEAEAEAILQYLEFRLKEVKGSGAKVTNVTGYWTTPWSPNN